MRSFFFISSGAVGEWEIGRPGAAIGIYTDTRSEKRAHFISLSVSEHGDVRQFAPPPRSFV